LSSTRPPLVCIFGMSRLYSTCIPPVSHRILGISRYPCIYLHLAILQQIHCIPLNITVYQAVSVRIYIELYPAVSRCISHRISPPRKWDMAKNTLQGRASTRPVIVCGNSDTTAPYFSSDGRRNRTHTRTLVENKRSLCELVRVDLSLYSRVG